MFYIVLEEHNQNQIISCGVGRAIWKFIYTTWACGLASHRVCHLHWPLLHGIVLARTNASRDEGCHGNPDLFYCDSIGYNIPSIVTQLL